MRILVVNPNTSADITATVEAAARRAAAPGTEIAVASGAFGPRYIGTRGENAVAGHAALAALAGHVPGCDGAVIAAFTDPAVSAAREVLPVPVVGMAEAAMLTACMLGGRFSIVTIARRLAPIFRELAAGYGLGSRLASVRALERSALDVAREPEVVLAGLADLGRAAIEDDGADVLILGGAPLGSLDRPLAERLGVPVLEGVGCAVRQVEGLVRLGMPRARAGSYAPPPPKEFVGVTPELARLFQTRDPEKAAQS
jgi:Asp/Glu/hydantoin racemase